jgi:hypothetical protein
MLWTIFVIVLVLWLLGLIGSVGGAFIHLPIGPSHGLTTR